MSVIDWIVKNRAIGKYVGWLDRSAGARAFHVVLPSIIFCGIILFAGWGHARIDELEEKVDLQRECIEALEDKTQAIADSLGIEW